MNKLICLLLLPLFSFMHPHYVSVTDLKYNASEKKIQGSVRVFTNDLENALKKIHKKPVDLINPKDTAATKNILKNYLVKNLLITVNGKSVAYDLLGFEQEKENVWLYIESAKTTAPKTLMIMNSILYNAIREQSNIVHCEVGGVKRSSKVNYPEQEIRFSY